MRYYKNLTIDEDSHSIKKQNHLVALTATEYQLFLTLLNHSGHICSRSFLLECAWHITTPIQTRTVDVHIARLRKKLELSHEDLKTVMGLGYVLSAQEACKANPISSLI